MKMQKEFTAPIEGQYQFEWKNDKGDSSIRNFWMNKEDKFKFPDDAVEHSCKGSLIR